MRVVHLLHSFPPASHGGVETYVSRLAAAQQRSTLDVLVVAGSDRDGGPAGVRHERVAGLPLLRLPPVRDGWDDGTSPALRAGIDQLCRRLRPDVVHVHHWHNLTADAAATARRAGAGVVVTLHDYFATCPLFHRLRSPEQPCPPELGRGECVRCLSARYPLGEPAIAAALERREALFAAEFAAASAVLALSLPEQATLLRIPALAGAHIRVLPLPRLAEPRATPRERRAQAGQLEIATWGGLVPGKGLHVLLEACARLCEPERVRVRHLGRVLDAAYAAALERFRARVRFELCGPYVPGELERVALECDLAVFPSLFDETHGVAVDEALALGLPLLVSDRGAPPHRLGGRGLAFPAGDALALAALLERLLDRPDEREALARGAPAPMPALEEHERALARVYRAALAR